MGHPSSIASNGPRKTLPLGWNVCPTSNSAETSSGAGSLTLPGMQNSTHGMHHFWVLNNAKFLLINQSFWRFKVILFTGLAAR